jgi:hypothetical protein
MKKTMQDMKGEFNKESMEKIKLKLWKKAP